MLYAVCFCCDEQERVEDTRMQDVELIGQYLIEGLNRADHLRLAMISAYTDTYHHIMQAAEVRTDCLRHAVIPAQIVSVSFTVMV